MPRIKKRKKGKKLKSKPCTFKVLDKKKGKKEKRMGFGGGGGDGVGEVTYGHCAREEWLSTSERTVISPVLCLVSVSSLPRSCETLAGGRQTKEWVA